jgi:integrase
MVYKRGKNYHYKFKWRGETIRRTTKQSNKRVAETMEAAHKTALAKGEVGIVDRKPVPTLAKFADEKFLPFIRATKAEKPRTVTFYETTVKNLKSYAKLANIPMDRITSEVIGAFVAHRQASEMQVSTINRELATVRRIFNLAQEWGQVHAPLPRVRLNPGEASRMRVLTPEEEERYLGAALEIGRAEDVAYRKALQGIRATVRGEEPIRPDAYLLHHVATILLDCGLRPEECYRLRWAEIRDGRIHIATGKGKGSRRQVPCTPRVTAILEMRLADAKARATETISRGVDAGQVKQAEGPEWVFPRATKSGHIEGSTINEQHNKARTAANLTGVVIYDFRHTRITRWAKVLPLPTVQRLAGHTSIATTMRYIHITDDDVVAAMAKEQSEAVKRLEAERGHKEGHSHNTGFGDPNPGYPNA